MNQELRRQQGIVGQLDVEIGATTARLNVVQRKIGELLDTDDAGQICTVLMMAAMCLLFTLLIFIF